MRPSTITVGLGCVLCILGVLGIFLFSDIAGIVPTLIGGSLIFLGFNRSRVGTLVFGHICILCGAYLITWGILLLPHSEPTLVHIFGRPLFWGIFSLMGGVCAIFHGFCRCVTKQVDQFEGLAAGSSKVQPTK